MLFSTGCRSALLGANPLIHDVRMLLSRESRLFSLYGKTEVPIISIARTFRVRHRAAFSRIVTEELFVSCRGWVLVRRNLRAHRRRVSFVLMQATGSDHRSSAHVVSVRFVGAQLREKHINSGGDCRDPACPTDSPISVPGFKVVCIRSVRRPCRLRAAGFQRLCGRRWNLLGNRLGDRHVRDVLDPCSAHGTSGVSVLGLKRRPDQ